MQLAIVGKKVGMTQVFDEKGFLIPVTVVDTSNCYVTQIKTPASDGYSAIQVAHGTCKPQNLDKARLGHYKKAEVPAQAKLSEISFEKGADLSGFKLGAKLNASMFAKGDRVDVVGTTKGKGFAGVMKRLGYKGKDATHGTSKYFRHGGSNGTNTFPGRVLKNKGMPGQTGNWQRTVQNVEVVDIKPDQNLILPRGAIPGPASGQVRIQSTVKAAHPAGRTWLL